MATLLDRPGHRAREGGPPAPRAGLSVAITGANGHVGRALLGRLAGTPAHIVALVQGGHYVHASRILSGPLASPPAAQALADADVVVHLAGALRPLSPNTYQAANVDTTRVVAHALRHGRARRVLFLSYVGADEASGNEYLRTKAEAERLLAAAGREVVVFRCTHIVGGPDARGPLATALTADPSGGVTVLGRGRQRLAPLFVGDVAAALATALEQGPPGAYELAGPEEMSLDDLVRLLNPDRDVRIRHVPGALARVLARLRPDSLPSALVDVMLRDSLGDPAQAAQAFGLQLTSLARVWG